MNEMIEGATVAEWIEQLKQENQQLQTKLAESEARVGRLEKALKPYVDNWSNDAGSSSPYYDEANYAATVLNETKSQSLQHIEAAAVNVCANDMIPEVEVINESPQHIADAAIDKYRNELKQQARTVRNFSNPKEIFVAIPVSALDVELRQQQTNESDRDE